MTRSILVLGGLLLISTLTKASWDTFERRDSEECESFFVTVKTLLDSMDGTKQCALDKLAREVFEIDIYDDETLKGLVCLAMENNENANTLYQALDNNGYIDKFVAALFSVAVTTYAPMGLGMLKTLGVFDQYGECLEQMPYMSSMLPPGLEDFDLSALGGLAEAIEKLGIIDLAAQKGSVGAMLADRIQGTWFRSFPPANPVCECSAITDPAERCRIIQDAAAPLLNILNSNMMVQMTIQGSMMMVTQVTGVNLIQNVQTDIPRLLCGIAKIQDISDVKKMLDNLQLTQPLMEMAYIGLSRHLEETRSNQRYTIEEYERNQQNDYGYSWPSEEMYNEAKAVTSFVDAFQASSLACLKPTFIPPPMASQMNYRCYGSEEK